jgi:outer membrane protein W
MPGYGWTNYNFHTTSSNTQFAWVNEFDVTSKGFPIQLELKYHHYLTVDSIFEPNIGLGVGYCNFKSSIKLVSPGAVEPYESDLTTKGFSQYIEFGMAVRISKRIKSFIEFQKLILSNIKTSGDLSALGYPYGNGFEEDYPSSSGFSDVGISFGVNYNL